ncbi:glycosyltransferase family 4 protein [Kocuria sp.]|uniref:glycosyltransferase family 4 protein n=1 Tax=Kocuria sp. TaxID=1871328 RepID=UPI0026DAB8A2|nr:glycosyltransferase family 4 protein [Kocuria sp.]MDO4919671.1 glycosyltransferase family 4 protein [Kocuria sp.]
MTTRRHRSPDHAPVVGYLGRLAPEKGIEALVSAMELLDGLDFSPSPRLEVGGAPLFVDRSGAKRVERALLSLGDRVFHHGWVERSSFLASIDVLACPSTWEEPFGLVAAEAMAARVPVVVSDAGALPEVVGPEHPYTARAGDPRSLARVLHRALRELGTDAGDAVVGRARRRWEELWSPAAGRARVAELLADLGVLA